MTEHEQFKYICDKIGYKIHSIYEFTHGNFINKEIITDSLYFIDVREIIFTQEFMDKLYQYEEYKGNDFRFIWDGLLQELNNPVEYLYNLIK